MQFASIEFLAVVSFAVFASLPSCGQERQQIKDIASILPKGALPGEIILPPGTFQGELKITQASVKLSARNLGDFILRGSILLDGAKGATLENIVVDGSRKEKGPAALLEIRNSEGVKIRNCSLFAFNKPSDPAPSVSEELCLNATGVRISGSSDIALEGTRVATNGARLEAFNSKELKLLGCELCEASAVGSQYATYLRSANVYVGIPSKIHGVSGLEMRGNVFRGTGRNHLVLDLKKLSNWSSEDNAFWGMASPPEDCLAGARGDEAVARSLQDWRELSGRDIKSRTARIDYVADKALGFKRDPAGALSGKPNISISLPKEIPGASISVGVFRENGSLARTLVAEYEPHGAKSLDLRWDGTGNMRTPIEAGSYILRAIAPNLKTEQSWIANSYGTYGSHVQQDILGIATAPDGTCFGICTWDEAGAEIKKYSSEGKSELIKKSVELHGWGRGGSSEIALDGKFIYAAISQSGDDGGNFPERNRNGLFQYPPKGKTWFCLRRYSFDGEAIPFPEGFGYDCSMLVLGEENCIGGLAAANGWIYVSNFKLGKLSEFDRETLKELRSWNVKNPGRLAFDRNNLLWILDKTEGAGNAASIQRLDLTNGAVKSFAIEGLCKPSAIAFDPAGRMLLGDNGPDMQIKIYDISGGAPKLVDSIGRKGGIYADVPGKTEPDKFNGITGIAIDPAGCVYVASSESGAELRKISPDKKIQWHLLGMAFVDCASADPDSPEDVFMKDERFVLDYSVHPAAWRYAACIRDRRKPELFPRSKRPEADFASTLIRRIDGKRFMFCTRMFPQAGLSAFKFEGEMATPSAFVKMEDDAMIWRDANGDGAMDANECQNAKDAKIQAQFLTGGDDGSWNWFVDSKGDVWKAWNTAGMMRLPCLGLDGKGNPIYDFAKAEFFPMPKPFIELAALEFIPESGALYVGGETESSKRNKADGWGPATRFIARYDGKAKLRWMTQVDTIANLAISVAGGLLFTIDSRSAQLQVYDAESGLKLGSATPGAPIGYGSGWTDFPMCIRAVALKNGETAVFVEEDFCAKVMLYRFSKDSQELYKAKLMLADDGTLKCESLR